MVQGVEQSGGHQGDRQDEVPHQTGGGTQKRGTGWPLIHYHVFMVTCKDWLV